MVRFISSIRNASIIPRPIFHLYHAYFPSKISVMPRVPPRAELAVSLEHVASNAGADDTRRKNSPAISRSASAQRRTFDVLATTGDAPRR
jgi:hypothetical protein